MFLETLMQSEVVSSIMQSDIVSTLMQASWGMRVLYGALFLVGCWCLSLMDAEEQRDRKVLRPQSPEDDAANRRALLAWQAQDKAERARTGQLSASEEYEMYLTAIHAQIAAQNRC